MRFAISYVEIFEPKALDCRRLKIEVDPLGLNSEGAGGAGAGGAGAGGTSRALRAAAAPGGLSPSRKIGSALGSGKEGEIFFDFVYRVPVPVDR